MRAIAPFLCAWALLAVAPGAVAQVPSIAVVPFAGAVGSLDVAKVVEADLVRSGRFGALPREHMPQRTADPREVNLDAWKPMDVDYIVTEYGCVNLRGKSTRERALVLMSIAHPNLRDKLKRHAKSINLI